MSSKHINRILSDDNEQGWMTTYADLMTLLLVFFVLLFSMSSLEKTQFSNMSRAFQQALSDSAGNVIPLPELLVAPTVKPPDTLEPEQHPDQQTPTDLIVSEPLKEQIPVTPEKTETQDEALITNALKEAFKNMGVRQDVTITDPKDGKIRIKVKGTVAFESGETEFKREMMPIMDSVIEILEHHSEYLLSIEGHTDSRQINSPTFATNWELSAVRATTVLRYFVRGGIASDRVVAIGYGDSKPIKTNISPEGRAANRRIEFVLEKRQGGGQ
jgi:chemotaxis protein MotB